MPGYTDVMGYLGDENSELNYLYDLLSSSTGTDLFETWAEDSPYGAEHAAEQQQQLFDFWGEYDPEQHAEYEGEENWEESREEWTNFLEGEHGFEEGSLQNMLDSLFEGQKMLLTPEEYGLEGKLASAKGKARRGTKKAGAKYIPREIGSRYGELQGRLAGGSGEAAEAGYEADVYGLQREAGTAGRDIRQDFADEYYGSIADWLQSTQ